MSVRIPVMHQNSIQSEFEASQGIRKGYIVKVIDSKVIYSLYDLLNLACKLTKEQELEFTRAIIKTSKQREFSGYTDDDLNSILHNVGVDTRMAVVLKLVQLLILYN